MSVSRIKIVELNVTELCNRKCSFCPRADPKIYKNAALHMSIETFAHVIRSLKESNYNGVVCISGFSEPLLCKNIIEGLQMLSSNFRCWLITNGDVLTANTLKSLDACNLEKIKIDLYDGEHQYERIMTMSQEIAYSRNNIEFNHVYKNSDLNFYNRGGSSSFESKSGVDQDRICTLPFYKAMIDWNGNYLLCHSDWKRESDISKSGMNVCDMSLQQYLSSKLYVEFSRKMIDTRRRGLTPCSVCDINGLPPEEQNETKKS